MMLRVFDRDTSSLDTAIINSVNRGSTVHMTYNLLGGSTRVTVWIQNWLIADTLRLTPDTLMMTSNSTYIDTGYNMSLKLWRTPTPFPAPDEAVGLRVPNVNFTTKGNSFSIDGHDHDINGIPILPSDGLDKPGVGVYTPGDTSKIISAEGPPLNNQIQGTSITKVDTNIANPAQYVALYQSAAQYNYTAYTGDTVLAGNMTWGSATNPVIVNMNSFTNTIKTTGNIEGWGILLCAGNLTLSGSFKFHGIVLSYSSLNIDDQVSLSSGSPTIIGAFIMAAPSGSTFQVNGNDTFAYSSAAVQNAQYIGRLLKYNIMSWYE